MERKAQQEATDKNTGQVGSLDKHPAPNPGTPAERCSDGEHTV